MSLEGQKKQIGSAIKYTARANFRETLVRSTKSFLAKEFQDAVFSNTTWLFRATKNKIVIARMIANIRSEIRTKRRLSHCTTTLLWTSANYLVFLSVSMCEQPPDYLRSFKTKCSYAEKNDSITLEQALILSNQLQITSIRPKNARHKNDCIFRFAILCGELWTELQIFFCTIGKFMLSVQEVFSRSFERTVRPATGFEEQIWPL